MTEQLRRKKPAEHPLRTKEKNSNLERTKKGNRFEYRVNEGSL